MTIKFRNEKHESDYRDLLSKMKSKDCYHNNVLICPFLLYHISLPLDIFNFLFFDRGVCYLEYQLVHAVRISALLYELVFQPHKTM